MDGTRAVRQIRWAIGFGIVAALAAALGAAIFAVWGDDGQQTGAAAAARTLRDGRVLVWVGFAAAVGFVLAGRDRMTSEVDSIFAEDRRVWSRRMLLERETAARAAADTDTARGSGSGPGPAASGLPGLFPGPGFDDDHDPVLDPGEGNGSARSLPTAAPPRPGVLSRPPSHQPADLFVPSVARRGPSGRLFVAGGVLVGAGIGAGLGALAGDLAPGAVLGVVGGLLVGLLLDRGDG